MLLVNLAPQPARTLQVEHYGKILATYSADHTYELRADPSGTPAWHLAMAGLASHGDPKAHAVERSGYLTGAGWGYGAMAELVGAPRDAALALLSEIVRAAEGTVAVLY